MREPTLPSVLSAAAILLVLAAPLAAQVRFQKTYGGADADYASDIVRTDDGGYLMAGRTECFGAGSYDAWLIRTDSLGDTLWTRTHGTSGFEGAFALSAIPGGGWYVAGHGANSNGYANVWVLRVDANGDTVWTRELEGQYNDWGWSVATTADGGCIVAGQTESYGAGYVDAWLIKFESDGDTAWAKTHGASDKWDIFYTVAQAPDGGYILGGANYAAGQREDAWLVKTDASGEEEWSHTYSGTAGAYEDFREVINVAGGGFAACGAWNGQLHLARLNNGGDTLWTRVYEGLQHIGYGMASCSDGGFVMTGSRIQDVSLVRVDSNGDTLWTRTYGGIDPDAGYAVMQTDDGYAVVGFTRSFGAGWFDAWFIKTDPNGSPAIAEPGSRPRVEQVPATITRALLYLPVEGNGRNAASSLLDESGRKVMDLFGGENDIRALAPGVYFVRSECASGSRKVLLAR